MKKKVVYRCDKRTVNVLQISYYADQQALFSTGHLMIYPDTPSEYIDVTPDSTGEYIMELVCNVHLPKQR